MNTGTHNVIKKISKYWWPRPICCSYAYLVGYNAVDKCMQTQRISYEH